MFKYLTVTLACGCMDARWIPRPALSDKVTLEPWLVPSTGPEGGIQAMIRTQDNSREGNGTPL